LRASFLTPLLLLAGCTPVPTEVVAADNNEALVMTENTVVANAEGDAVVPDAMPAANARPLPCVDTDGYDTCLAGKRAMPGKPCFEITAYLEDAVKQREVHAEPDAGSRMLGRILGVAPGDEGRPATFEVLDSRDGWLLIDGATDDPQINGGIDRPMYHGKGWIRGEGVGVSAQADQGFVRPDFASEIVSEGGWFDGDMRPVAILGCDGSWVHARWTRGPEPPPHPVRYSPAAIVSRDPLVIDAWVTGVCPAMETTCDGLSGNRPAE
jgi:hypothetical protein